MGYRYISRQAEIDEILPDLMAREVWGFDTETSGLDPHRDKIILLQLGTAQQQFVIDTRRVNVEPLRVFFEDKMIKKVAHNGKFDYKMMRGSFNICVENLRDTFYGEKLLTVGKKFSRFNLRDVAYDRLKVVLEKDTRDTFGLGYIPEGDFTKEQLSYAARDVEVLLPLFSSQLKDMTNDGLLDTFLLECGALPCFGDMEYDGMYLNAPKWLEIILEHEKAIEEVVTELDQIASSVMPRDMFGTSDRVNWSSPDQVTKVLQGLMVKAPTRMADGSYKDRLITKSDDKTLKKVRGVRVIELLRKYRGHKIRVSTFGYPYLNAVSKVTEKLHPEFDQIGTETGRPANTSKKNSVNMLNIPKDKRYRNCFCGGAEEVVETDDYSGCETRIWAEISGDPGLTEAFAKGVDVHCYVASLVFGREIKKTDPERTPAKSLNFGGH